MIDVSIIIINYNTFKLTSDCLRSVIAQTSDVSYEIILVDNASFECDPKIFKKAFPQIKLIESKTNLGFAGGNNLGIEQSNGEFVLLLNSDTILQNNAIGITWQQMLSKRIKLATCKVLNFDGTVQPTCAYFPSVRFSLLGLLGILQLSRKIGWKATSYTYDYSQAHTVEYIWGCFFFFKREVLFNFSGSKLPEDFFMYAEDMQWCYLLRKKRIYAWYLPGGIITHFFSGNKLSHNPDTNMNIRNTIIFIKKYYSPFRAFFIFLFDTLIAVTRFKFQFLFKKIRLYLTLRK